MKREEEYTKQFKSSSLFSASYFIVSLILYWQRHTSISKSRWKLAEHCRLCVEYCVKIPINELLCTTARRKHQHVLLYLSTLFLLKIYADKQQKKKKQQQNHTLYYDSNRNCRSRRRKWTDFIHMRLAAITLTNANNNHIICHAHIYR